MDCVPRLRRVAVIGILSLVCSGCSTLGLSFYPTGATLTSEAEAVLNASPIPRGIPRENAKTVLMPHALQPGDAVLIESLHLEGDLQLPADQTVLADGTLDLGAYGRVVVAGRDLEQAEALIEQQIVYQIRSQRAACQQLLADSTASSGPSPGATSGDVSVPAECDTIAVNVRLLEPVHRYYVLGEVNAPGSYPLEGYETVLDAIVAAGGLTNTANPCKILLARPTDPSECRVTLPVCYRQIVQLGNTASNYQLQPNDRIFVASRSCLDELLFWRANETCARCAACNRSCRGSIFSTVRPLAMVEATMIPPGSVGWHREGTRQLQPSDLRDQGEAVSPIPTPWRPNPASQRLPPPTTPNADVDGELEF